MEYIIALIGCLILITIIACIFALNIKKIKNIAENKRLNELTQKFPSNMEICRRILKMLDNEKVKIKEKTDSKNKTSLYIAITDTILIADINDTFTRIQTIAHECLHSIQNRKMLLLNFFFTNIYAIYFGIVTILTIAGVIKNYNIQITILALMGFIQYIVRSYLETDAMVKAEYLAQMYMKDYIKENKVCTIEEVEEITNEYKNVNKLGIPMYNFELVIKAMTKPVIYIAIVLISSL